jgi:uncharacterized protein YecT (DUF1311 family)
MRGALLLFVLLWFSPFVFAAGFDCREAGTQEERLICSDPMLSALDGEMGSAFKGLVASGNQDWILQDQRRWLAVRGRCLTVFTATQASACLKVMTKERRRTLIRLAHGDRALASADEPSTDSVIGERIRGRCHMDYCYWFSIHRRSLVGRSPLGEALYKLDNNHWQSHHPGASYDIPALLEEEPSGSWYAFCSHRNPRFLFQYGDGAWAEHELSPNDASGIHGYNITSYIFYYAACHDIGVDDPYVATLLAKELGYDLSGKAVKEVDIGSPEDLIR